MSGDKNVKPSPR